MADCERADEWFGYPSEDQGDGPCACGHYPASHIAGDGPCRRCSCHTYTEAPEDETLLAIEKGGNHGS